MLFAGKRKILEEKKGPVLLDTLTYRISGHSPSDASSYRSKDEIEAWKRADAIDEYALGLIEAKVAEINELEEIRENTKKLITHIMKLAIDDNISPRMDIETDPDGIGKLMFSNGSLIKWMTVNLKF